MWQRIVICCALLELCSAAPPAHINRLALFPDKSAWCEAKNITQIVGHTGCQPRSIQNRACLGQCFSYSVPNTFPQSTESLVHCDSCMPAQTQWEVLQSCPIAATLVRTRERRRSRDMHPPKHDPAEPHCFLTHCPLNPEASRTIVSEETQYNWRRVSVHAPGRHKESLEHDGTRTFQPAKPSPNPNDEGSIVHRLMGLPVTAGCDTARIEPGYVVTPQALRCLRLLRHLGGPIKVTLECPGSEDTPRVDKLVERILHCSCQSCSKEGTQEGAVMQLYLSESAQDSPSLPESHHGSPPPHSHTDTHSQHAHKHTEPHPHTHTSDGG